MTPDTNPLQAKPSHSRAELSSKCPDAVCDLLLRLTDKNAINFDSALFASIRVERSQSDEQLQAERFLNQLIAYLGETPTEKKLTSSAQFFDKFFQQGVKSSSWREFCDLFEARFSKKAVEAAPVVLSPVLPPRPAAELVGVPKPETWIALEEEVPLQAASQIKRLTNLISSMSSTVLLQDSFSRRVDEAIKQHIEPRGLEDRARLAADQLERWGGSSVQGFSRQQLAQLFGLIDGSVTKLQDKS